VKSPHTHSGMEAARPGVIPQDPVAAAADLAGHLSEWHGIEVVGLSVTSAAWWRVHEQDHVLAAPAQRAAIHIHAPTEEWDRASLASHLVKVHLVDAHDAGRHNYTFLAADHVKFHAATLQGGQIIDHHTHTRAEDVGSSGSEILRDEENLTTHLLRSHGRTEREVSGLSQSELRTYHGRFHVNDSAATAAGRPVKAAFQQAPPGRVVLDLSIHDANVLAQALVLAALACERNAGNDPVQWDAFDNPAGVYVPYAAQLVREIGGNAMPGRYLAEAERLADMLAYQVDGDQCGAWIAAVRAEQSKTEQ
jgi:hypothetical protein